MYRKIGGVTHRSRGNSILCNGSQPRNGELPLRWETENDGKQPNGLERQPGIPEMMDAHDGKILILVCPNHRQLEIPPCGKGSRVSRHPLNFCRVQTDSGKANASFCGGYPAAVLKRNRTYVHILYR